MGYLVGGVREWGCGWVVLWALGELRVGGGGALTGCACGAVL